MERRDFRRMYLVSSLSVYVTYGFWCIHPWFMLRLIAIQTKMQPRALTQLHSDWSAKYLKLETDSTMKTNYITISRRFQSHECSLRSFKKTDFLTISFSCTVSHSTTRISCSRSCVLYLLRHIFTHTHGNIHSYAGNNFRANDLNTYIMCALYKHRWHRTEIKRSKYIALANGCYQ